MELGLSLGEVLVKAFFRAEKAGVKTRGGLGLGFGMGLGVGLGGREEEEEERGRVEEEEAREEEEEEEREGGEERGSAERQRRGEGLALSLRASDKEENELAGKKLRLSKEQSAFLEESFKEHKPFASGHVALFGHDDK